MEPFFLGGLCPFHRKHLCIICLKDSGCSNCPRYHLLFTLLHKLQLSCPLDIPDVSQTSVHCAPESVRVSFESYWSLIQSPSLSLMWRENHSTYQGGCISMRNHSLPISKDNLFRYLFLNLQCLALLHSWWKAAGSVAVLGEHVLFKGLLAYAMTMTLGLSG